ncbi:hypothetical protein BDE02_09G132400 [Populus trichocarpa]|nr:hypothetical protein BDE02_09G132400 [Populus trichocarpa]
MHGTYIKDMNLGQGYMPEFARFWSFMLLTGRVSYLAMDWQHLEAVWTRRALWTQRASLNERRLKLQTFILLHYHYRRRNRRNI